MKKKYLYIIIGWALVFSIYSLFLYLNSDIKKDIQNVNINESISEEKKNIITIDIPGINDANEKIPIILNENFQQMGVYTKVINHLLKNKSKENFYNNIKLNNLYYIKGEKEIVVDFNEEMIVSFPGGTAAEFEFLNYIVDNVFLVNTLLNADYKEFDEIKKISFLSSGSSFPTISGHLNLDEPFMKNSKIITPYVNVRQLLNESDISIKPIQRIFIDPGHGGENKGVISETDELEEKNINLIISKKLRRRIINTFGIDTILTRNIDKDMSLDSRTSMANNQKAGLFISIHVNYSFKNFKKGSETYITSFNPIIKAADTLLVQNKNEENLDNEELNNETISSEITIPQEKKVLENWNRTQEKYLSESYKVAQLVQIELNSLNSTSGRKVSQIPIRLLSSVSMPALLIEVAFLSNSSDRKKLKQEYYLNNLSDAIFRGISKYINSQVRAND